MYKNEEEEDDDEDDSPVVGKLTGTEKRAQFLLPDRSSEENTFE